MMEEAHRILTQPLDTSYLATQLKHAGSYSELALIACIVRSPDAFDRARGIVTSGDLAEAWQQDVWNTVTRLADQGDYDPVQVSEELDHWKAIQTINTMSEIDYSLDRVETYAQQVRSHAMSRKLHGVLLDAALKLEQGDDVEGVATMTSLAVEELNTRKHGNSKTFHEIIEQAVQATLSAAERGTGLSGIPTGIPALDRRTGGLEAGRLIVIAARPSHGKTAIACQAMLHAARHGYPVGMTSLEMRYDELGQRAMAHLYGLNGTALARGHRPEAEKMQQELKAKSISELPIHVDDSALSLDAIVSRITEWHRTKGIKLAIVDHIGLVEFPGTKLSKNEQMGLVSRTLKQTAKKLAIPIIAVSQLNRANEKEQRKPMMSDLRDSGSIEQDADVVIMLHTEKENENLPLIPMHIGCVKNRTGRKGWLPQKFLFEGSTQTFKELDEYHEEFS